MCLWGSSPIQLIHKLKANTKILLNYITTSPEKPTQKPPSSSGFCIYVIIYVNYSNPRQTSLPVFPWHIAKAHPYLLSPLPLLLKHQ